MTKEDKPVKKRNDNKEQERANFYKVLVAMHYILNEKVQFSNLILEHNGDITFDNNIQIEVKQIKKTLGNTSIEFWNTFYNWVIDENILKFNRLILHTTQDLTSKSFFNSWENKSIETKFFLLKEAFKESEARTQASEFHSKIFQKEDNFIKQIVQKIEIKTSQLNDVKLTLRIADAYQISIDDKYRAAFVKDKFAAFIYSEVSKEGKWIIAKEDFYKISRENSQSFNASPLDWAFESNIEKEIQEDNEKLYSSLKFVKELENIECSLDEITDAITDYWKTNNTIMDLITSDAYINFINDYRIYQKENIFRALKNEKQQHLSHKNSIEFYRSIRCKSFESHKKIPKYSFFEQGTVHRIIQKDDINDLNFTWSFN